MNSMKKLGLGLLVSTLCATTVSALEVDFTNNYYQPFFNGNSSTTSWINILGGDGLKVKVSTSAGDLQWSNESNGGTGGDGIGVNNDEVTGDLNENLRIDFSESVIFQQIKLYDLFYELNDQVKDPLTQPGYYEVGYYQLGDGGVAVQFLADGTAASQLWGEKIVNIDNVEASYILLTAPHQAMAGDNDYAFGSATFVKSVPEPATISLLGFSLVGLVGLGLRRRKNA